MTANGSALVPNTTRLTRRCNAPRSGVRSRAAAAPAAIAADSPVLFDTTVPTAATSATYPRASAPDRRASTSVRSTIRLRANRRLPNVMRVNAEREAHQDYRLAAVHGGIDGGLETQDRLEDDDSHEQWYRRERQSDPSQLCSQLGWCDADTAHQVDDPHAHVPDQHGDCHG